MNNALEELYLRAWHDAIPLDDFKKRGAPESLPGMKTRRPRYIPESVPGEKVLENIMDEILAETQATLRIES